MALSRALVLERQHELALRDIDLPQAVGPGEVRVKITPLGSIGRALLHAWADRAVRGGADGART